MKEIKKPRTGDENPEAGQGAVSAVQSTPERKPSQGIIAELLGTGKGNATPTKHLMMLTGWDERTVRKQIEWERRRGIPILSCKDGYFLSADEYERAAFVASMRGRAREIMRTAEAVEREGRG